MNGTAHGQFDDLAGQVISAAITVHKCLGPGFLESAYEKALLIELEHEGIPCESQKVVPIRYRGQLIGEHRLDILVAGKIIVELKAVKELDPIFFAVVRSYMKALALHDALLFNFSSMPLTVKRVGIQRETHSEKSVPDFMIS